MYNYVVNYSEIIDLYHLVYDCHALPIESVYLTLVGTLLRFSELVHTSAHTLWRTRYPTVVLVLVFE